MRGFAKFLVALALIVAALLFGRNVIIKKVVEHGVKTMNGFDVSIGDIDVGILRPLIHIRNLKITNPPDFPEKEALDAKEIYVRYDLTSIFSDELHFHEIIFDIPRAVVVWNGNGDMNFDRMAGTPTREKNTPKPEPKHPEPAPAPTNQPGPAEKTKEKAEKKIRIDTFTVRIAEAQMYDYRKGPEPQVMTFPLNLDRTYKDVTNPNRLAAKLVAEVTSRYLAMLINNVGKKMEKNGDTKKINDLFKNLGKTINDMFKKKEP